MRKIMIKLRLPITRLPQCSKWISFIFIFFFLMIISFSYGQRDYLFENISIPEGLSNTNVRSIFQDSKGFLWISTADGLNRYDGYSMKVFKNDPNDPKTIPNNFCDAIAEDAEGNIWIGVYGNMIAKYDPVDDSFERVPIDFGSENNISQYNSALFDSKGNLWFATTLHGVQRFNRSTNTFERIPLDSSNNIGHWGQISHIAELKNGNILVADYGNGIKIYNETLNSFQTYFLKANYSPDNINIIFEDNSGNIWFGGHDQVIRYTPLYYTTENFNLFSHIEDNPNFNAVTGIIQDNEGYIWVGVYWNGLFRIDAANKTTQKIDYSQSFFNSSQTRQGIIWTMFQDKYNVNWLGTMDRGLIKFDPLKEPFNFHRFETDELIHSGTNVVTAISGSPQENKISVGTSGKGLFTYDLVKREFENIKIRQATNQDAGINIQGLAVDNNGNKWFSYNGGEIQMIDKNNAVSSFNSPQENKAVNLAVKEMKVDLSNNVWIASEYGFESYNSVSGTFSLLPTIMTKMMSETLRERLDKIAGSRKPIASILKAGEAVNLEKSFSLDKDQKVLIISVGEGRIVQGNNGLFDMGSLTKDKGEPIWSMNDLSKTYNDGGGFKNRIAFKCLDLKKGDYTITYVTDVGHSYGFWNVIPPPDSLWYGIQLLELNDDEFSTLSQLNQNEIDSDKYMPMEVGTCIEMSKSLYNVVWLGSRFNSFFKYDLSTGDFEQYNLDTINKFSPINLITYIFEDREGIVWIATQNKLIRFDPGTENIEKFDQEDGLPSSQVNSIIEDHQANLWLSTTGGLSKLNKNAPRDKWNFVNFDTKDGLESFSSSRASWISEDGKIIIGSNDGIISFYPGKINKVKPDIVIQDIKLNDISINSDSSMVQQNANMMDLDEIKFSYNQNNLSFEFSSIHFSRSEKNRVFYKLEGFNDNWIESDRNYASYTNLRPGEYTFMIKGSNGDGIWNDEGKSIKIVISPPWWRTKLAYGFYILMFALLVFGSDRYFRNRLIKRERERNRAKEVEQAREIEKAYNKLKATQTQLLHSEKMASLGELTAGIAHEIQNPLNFVNNFSDVSVDLVDEMNEEMDSGNANEAKEIAMDLKQNLEMINHHGERASFIVRGMLEHSRTSTGEKKPTDIKILAEEFLKLSYHGLRARDNSFNAEFKTEFDKDLPLINVVAQDIGRVILNLINNAFYTVREKQKQSIGDYQPIVRVSTAKKGNMVEIRVSDNGNGIPADVKEKIFQPFFTTKPTGEGTGLGLSLSYDIVTKGHSGLMTFNTKDEGTEFIVVLPID